jgi:hypothetical protein
MFRLPSTFGNGDRHAMGTGGKISASESAADELSIVLKPRIELKL